MKCFKWNYLNEILKFYTNIFSIKFFELNFLNFLNELFSMKFWNSINQIFSIKISKFIELNFLNEFS